MNKILLVIALCFGSLGQLMAQSIEGRVIDEENNPIVGKKE